MKKDCHYYMEEFLSIGKGERLPLSLTLHLLSCSRCRREVRLLSKAEKLSAKALKISIPLESNSITQVMREIDSSYSPQTGKVSIMQWVLTGLVLLACMVLLALFISPYGELLTAYSCGIFAAALIAYCAVFVGTNLDFFIKKIDTHNVFLTFR